MSEKQSLSWLESISGPASSIGNWFGDNYQGLLALGSAFAKKANRPDYPDVPSYTPEAIPERTVSDFMPYADLITGMQADTALRMLSGELPASVTDQIKTVAGERAIQGGFGASTTRSRNILARDLGLASLDVVQQGMNYSSMLYNRASAALDRAYDADSSRAQQAYDVYASNVRNIMNKYRAKANERSAFIDDITGGLGSLGSSMVANKATRIAEQKMDEYMSKYDLNTISIKVGDGTTLEGTLKTDGAKPKELPETIYT
jgi:hypothetical protein|tara:strand:+ start:315 stop:1097 length:783 start_codon:yes stop_codon:yes gene_type:complete